MWRRRALSGAAVLAAVGLALALFLTVGSGGPGSGTRASRARVPAKHRQGAEAVALRWRFSSIFGNSGRYFYGGGIRKPPGGAELVHKRVLLSQPTVAGTARIWVAPDFAVRGRCAWLTIGARVYGGGCRRAVPPRAGLSEVVPLRLRIDGRTVELLWGQVGSDVATVRLHFRGRVTGLRLAGDAFLYVFPNVPRAVAHGRVSLVASTRSH